MYRVSALAVLLIAASSLAADPGLELFEKKIRPLLVEHCQKCHSVEADKAKKLKANLFLDSRAGILKGGDSGPIIVTGDPKKSLLLRTLHYAGDTKMPPAGKLPEAAIADFERWIVLGAPDPREPAAGRKQVGMSVEEGRKFWSYRPLQSTKVPAVKTEAWPKSEIDRFILAALEAKGVTPTGDADRATLARRIYFDLVGLPPTLAEVDAFIADKAPKAFENLVDKLLRSPAFGERWGRHWLDVARFGESLTLRGFILKEAWRYRDYAIDAFNRDMPFDQFIREQIAGDLLPSTSLEDRRRQLVATAFLAIGNNNLEEQDKVQLRMDVVDEQLDVITKGFLAQTVTCARCHDHKFDPIPTKDYYALAGILRNAKAMDHDNVSKWVEVSMPGTPEQESVLRKHDQAVALLQAKIKAEKAKGSPKAIAKILPVADIPGIVVDDAQAKKVGEWQHSVHSGHYIGEGYVHDMNMGKGEKTLTFQPDLPVAGKYEVRLAYSPGTTRSEAVQVTIFSADGEKSVMVDMRKEPAIDSRFVSLGEYRVERNGQCYVMIENEDTKGHVTADAMVFISTEKPAIPKKDKPAAKSTGSLDLVKALEAELKSLQASGPKRQMVMTVVEEAKIEDAKVHVRGSVHNLGAVAPRGYLQVAGSFHAPKMPTAHSGRKELAEWIASKENPLTSRVMANRVWHWLLGSGIVRTVDNFGTTGEKPSNPELLDHLAIRFLDNGWSIKKLVREIVLSRTYQQHSTVGAESAPLKVDPENQLFGRAIRRRLDAECIRDSMLVVSDRLSHERGGPSYPSTLASDYGYKGSDLRRSVYLPLFRNAMPEALEVFDIADTSMVTGRRNSSTVAPQALFLLNHPFPAEQAKYAATRILANEVSDEKRITHAYRLTLGRTPTVGERKVAEVFLTNAKDPKEAWATIVHALFASADFRYVD